MVESLSKAKQKWVRSLQQKKTREELGLFVVEGEKMVLEGLQLFSSNLELLIVVKQAQELIPKELVHKAFIVSQSELEQISELKTPNKLLAVFKRPQFRVESTGKILVLDGVQDPGNMGTIMRVADWFGIKQLICSNDTVNIYNSKVVQATMGAIFRVNVAYTDLQAYLKESKLPKYAALLNGQNYKTINFPEHLILIMGNEGKGIRPEILPYIDHPITIPRIGEAESLNVSTATAILVAEITG